MKNYSKAFYFSNRIGDDMVKTGSKIGLKERCQDFHFLHVSFDMRFRHTSGNIKLAIKIFVGNPNTVFRININFVVINMEIVLRARHYCKHFVSIISFNTITL